MHPNRVSRTSNGDCIISVRRGTASLGQVTLASQTWPSGRGQALGTSPWLPLSQSRVHGHQGSENRFHFWLRDSGLALCELCVPLCKRGVDICPLTWP